MKLLTIQNLGKLPSESFEDLGISSIQQLAHADPNELFNRLAAITKQTQKSGLWDMFAAIIHKAKTVTNALVRVGQKSTMEK